MSLLNSLTDDAPVCDLPELTACHAQALQVLLCAAAPARAALRFRDTREVDLAGVQLLLAFRRLRLASGKAAFGLPLPEPVQSALALAGCLDAAGNFDIKGSK